MTCRAEGDNQIDELYDLRRRGHPEPVDHSENFAAVRGPLMMSRAVIEGAQPGS
jgi:hypothetical protein